MCFGEVPKWLKGFAWKADRSLIAARGFESPLLRHYKLMRTLPDVLSSGRCSHFLFRWLENHKKFAIRVNNECSRFVSYQKGNYEMQDEVLIKKLLDTIPKDSIGRYDLFPVFKNTELFNEIIKNLSARISRKLIMLPPQKPLVG